MIPAMRPSRGFTLIELMVSMAIGSIVLLAAASILGSSGDGYERVGSGISAEREARAAISRITSDLSTAVWHKDGVIEKSTAAWPADHIGFLSLQPAEAQTDSGRIGDLCAVNYYIDDLTINGRTVRCLMRGFRESVDSFKALEEDSVPALFTRRKQIDEPVAFGVVSFQARPKTRDGSGAWSDWAATGTTGPDALDVRLVIARRGLTGRLKTSGDWDGTDLLGDPAGAEGNKDLEIYGMTIRFGNHENP